MPYMGQNPCQCQGFDSSIVNPLFFTPLACRTGRSLSILPLLPAVLCEDHSKERNDAEDHYQTCSAAGHQCPADQPCRLCCPRARGKAAVRGNLCHLPRGERHRGWAYWPGAATQTRRLYRRAEGKG